MGQFVVAVYAQIVSTTPNLQFNRISKGKGLSNDSVRTLFQDSKGFIWVGTQDGLNRYDGNHFEVFRHLQEDPHSLSGNHILSIMQDRDGFLWVGTNSSGINRFDPRTLRSERFRHRHDDPRSLSDDRVIDILEDLQGRIWVATDAGLNLLNTPNGFIHFETGDEPDALPSMRVTALFEDQAGRVWVGTQRGLARLKKDGSGFEIWRAEPRQDGLRNDFILTIFEDSKHRLWVGTSNGLFQMLDENLFRYFRGARIQDDHHPDPINKIWEDEKGQLWLGTHGGLGLLDPESAKLTLFDHDSSNQKTVPGNRINTILKDHSGLIWLATDSNGLCYFNPQTLRFRSVGYGTSKTYDTIGDPRTVALYEDLEGYLWIGTLTGGLKRFDPTSEDIEKFDYTQLGESGTLSGTVRAITEGPDGLIWIGVAGSGLMSFDRITEIFTRFQHIPGDAESIAHNDIRALLMESSGMLWVGNQDAVDLFDTKQRKVVRSFSRRDEEGYIDQGYLAKIYREGNNLWLGVMARGLFKVDLATGQVTNYVHNPDDPTSMSHKSPTDMLIDSQNRFWVGTQGGGINLVLSRENSPAGLQFKAYTRSDGLAADAIGGILEDDDGFIWVSTTTGISRFDAEMEQFINYGSQDGLPPHSYIIGSYNEGFSGRLYFGGWQGITYFSPKDFESIPSPPITVLTNFRLFNLVVKPQWQDEDSPLTHTISFTETLQLKHHQSAFSLEFAALDFASPEEQRYSYQMQGWDDRWIKTNARQPFATYTNLDPGSYTFRVRAANARNEWHQSPTELKIVILPPPWATWWAYTIYALVIGGLILVYITGQRRKLAYKARVIRRLRDLDKMKDQFLANTSHELRTPLNGIIGLTESLIDGAAGKPNELMTENLDMIAGSAKRLAHLVNDILDFSKLRHDKLAMQASVIDLRLVVDSTLRLNKPLLGPKPVTMINQVPSGIKVLADENRLQQVFHNLIGNAIKFTESGSIKVNALKKEGFVEVCIQDTGIGISEKHQRRIFESFEQADGSTARIYGGAGLGLSISKELIQSHGGKLWVNSRPTEGSEFYFTMPAVTEDAEKQIRLAVADEPAFVEENLQLNEEPEPTLDDFDAIPTQQFLRPKFWILIVDDDPVNRRVLINHLNLANYAVLEAEDGQEAIDIIMQQKPVIDLVILDVMMPRLSGYETCFKLREQFPMQELPILILTARNNDNDIVRAFSSGANDFLNKPVSKTELLSRVRTHLQLKDINRNLEVKVTERTRELQETHEQLMEAAHRAGMAEVAINVLHNMGNALNSSRASLVTIRKFSDPRRIQGFLKNIQMLLETHLDALRAIPESGDRLVKLPEGIARVIEELDRKTQSMVNEVATLEHGIEKMIELVVAQRQYAETEVLYSRVNLLELVDMVIANQTSNYNARDISLRFQSELKQAKVNLQKTKFIAVLIHLINNAAEALNQAPVGQHYIDLGLIYTRDKTLELHIKDDGPGIPEHLKNRVFEQGFSTKDHGSGIGLHFCANAMREMGGQLNLIEEKEGAHFVIRIAADNVLEVDF